ncbi:TPM domain-containing protein [Thermodesulfobacteriota bacterium]
MKAEHFFTKDEAGRIEKAVRSAETRTIGEIVPMIVAESDDYTEIQYAGGLVIAVAAFILLALTCWPASPFIILLTELVGFVAGFALFGLPALTRFVLSRAVIDENIRDRASRAFYEHGLNRTREETGVLIMISLLEHRVQVLADRGINEKVEPGTWDEIVSMIIRGIKEGKTCDAFCRAIEQCGDLLSEHFPIRPDDINELDNRLITEQ